VSEVSFTDSAENDGSLHCVDSSSQERSDQIMQLLTGEQHSLFRYITALIGDPDEAGNILQETNLVIWRKASDFTLGGNFGAWARSIALWQVKAWLRDRRRDRHIFSLELIAQLAARPAAFADIGLRRQALRKCVTVLEQDERELLRQRYSEGYSILEIAKRFQKTPSAVKSGLFRIRRTLRQCVEHRMTENV
jgi:RNA polymerase sigma-70 factor (ECF subfamily)